jgi:hypothetical protein
MTMATRCGLVAASLILLSALPLLTNSISIGPQAMEGDLKVSPGSGSAISSFVPDPLQVNPSTVKAKPALIR